MNKIPILAIIILLILPLFAVFLPWVAANSVRGQLPPFPKVRDEKSVSDFIYDEVQPQMDGFEKFPKELKPLQRETPIDQEDQVQTRFDTKDPSAEITVSLPDQSNTMPKPSENNYTILGGNNEPLGSTSVVFSETFEGTFPGDNWWVGDANPSSDSDYWDDTSYRAASGSWSGWCAQVGDNSVYGGTNVQQHKYDNYMDAYISKKYTVDMSAWDIGYVDFYAWYDTESSYDYLIAGWYDGSSFRYDNNYMLTGTVTSWSRYYWRIPDSYLISSGAFSFSFHSDGSVVREGVYLDNTNLVRADITLDNYYISPSSVHPGESFTAYYYVSNPCPFSITVGLGLSIRSPGGTIYNDLAHDTQVTIGPGASWVSRQFTVPSSAPFGSYDVMWGIHSKTPGTSGREWGYTAWQRVLTVAGWPDLMWTDIWTNPSSPTGGQNARIYCQIKNQGESTSISFTNYFYIDGSYDSYGVNNGLGAGSSFNWHMDRTLGPGYHTILARADVNNNVQESNEANNDYSEKIWWKGPDLIVVDIWWIDAYGNRNPVITSGQPFTVYFQIKNNGDANAIGTFTSYIFVDGWGNAAGSNNGLAAGATFTWYIENVYVSSIGSHAVRAVVDYNGVIAEANKDTGNGIGTGETNNERTISLTVARASWTLLAYLDGDNNLEGYQINDILSMAQVGSTTSVSVLVELDRNPGYDTRYNNWADCRTFFITQGLQPYDTNALSSLGEVNMGASATLSSFALWGIGRCQADKYLLVIEDHGGSWVGCCWDDTNGGDRLDSSEIKSALSTVSSTLGRKIDLVWFNDCLMGSIEIAAQVYQHCSYMAASETVGWTDTWAYNSLLNSLVTNPSVSPQQYCIQITNLANLHDSPTHVTQSVCSIDLSKTSNVVTASNSLSQSLKNNLYQYRSQIQTARTSCSWMEGPYGDQDQRIIDLYQFAQNIRSTVPDSTIQAQAQEILNQIGPAGGSTGYVVMRERHSTSASFCHGLSIYFPSDSTRYNNPSGYTTGVDFTSNTQWDEFLTCYYDVTPPNNPNSYTSSHSLRVWSSDNTIEVTWSGASDDLSGIYGYSRIWDTSSGTIPDATVDQTGTFCISFPVSTGNSWYLHVRAVDNSGNWNPGAYHVGPFYVDASPPNTPSISESHCGTGWTSHNSPYFEWNNPGDEGSGVSSYEGSINDGTPFSVSAPYHPAWSDGTYTFKVRTVDGVGLRSGWSNTITVMIDTAAPSNPDSYSTNPPVDVWSNDNTIDISWSGASDSLSGVYGYSYMFDQLPSTIPDTTVDTAGTSLTGVFLTDNIWYFHIRTRDNAGNWASGAFHVGPLKMDTTAPSQPSPDDGVSGWSNDNTPTFSWSPSSDSGSGVAGYYWRVDSSSETWIISTSVTLPVQSDGSHTFYVKAVDNAGNPSGWGSHGFQIDTSPPSAPTISSPTHPDESAWYSDNGPTFEWTTPSDLSGIAGYSYILDNSPSTTPDEIIYTTDNSKSYTDVSDGTWYFHVRAKDNVGNWGLPDHYRVRVKTTVPEGYIYQVVRGLDNRIYYCRNSSSVSWESWNVLTGLTCDSPAATVCSGKLHFVVRGFSEIDIYMNYSLWYGSVDVSTGSFLGWTGLSGLTSSAPTLTSNGTHVCLVVRGLGNRIYYRVYSCESEVWGSWRSVPAGLTCDSPAAAMLGNELHMVVRGCFSSGSVYLNYTLWYGSVDLSTGSFLGWTGMSGLTSSTPTLTASQAPDKLCLVVRGLDDRIYYNVWNSLGWEGWTSLPSGFTCERPAATVIGNELHFVVIGLNGMLWHSYVDLSNGDFPGWTRVSGDTESPPTLAS